MKLATIVLGIAAAAVAAPIEPTRNNNLQSRQGGLGGLGEVASGLGLGLGGSGGKARRGDDLESTDNKLDRREASPLGTEVLGAVVPAVAGLAGGLGGGGAKVRREESITDAATLQERQLPVSGDVVDKLLKVVKQTGLKRDESVVSKEDGTI